jgi:hypothetical protein
MRRDQSNQAKFAVAMKRLAGRTFVLALAKSPRRPSGRAYRRGHGFAYNQRFVGEVSGAAEVVCGDGECE